jgi:xanthine dehydrogenase accessory factor
MDKIFDKITELQKNRQKAVLCTIVSTKGSAPRKINAKMIVTDDLKIFGTIGGGALELSVIEKAGGILKTGAAQLISYNLTKDLAMACGGSVDVYIEPLFSNNKLYIFGAGHIGKALVGHLINMNFEIFVIDDRDNIFDDWSSVGFTPVTSKFSDFIKNCKFDESSYIVIVTKSHESDREVLKHCIKSRYAYIGMIGSKRKAQEIRKEFVTQGIVSEDEFDRVDIPIGMEIKAEGPEEIAISIAGKLILEKNKRMELVLDR